MREVRAAQGLTSNPATSISPSLARSSHRETEEVVLPAPLAPLRTTNSPFSTLNEMSLQGGSLIGPLSKTCRRGERIMGSAYSI